MNIVMKLSIELKIVNISYVRRNDDVVCYAIYVVHMLTFLV